MNAHPLSGEDALIAALAKHLPSPKHTQLAIGDDAAAIPLPDGNLLLITTDLLMEDVHFRLSWDALPSLGWKALAQNLSDIAAMGGTPTHAVIAIGIPSHLTAEQAVEIYTGLADLARQTDTDIIGGDTIRSSGPLTITLTVLGKVAQREMLTRRGAQPGDALFVTGTLGRAAAGLQLLDSNRSVPASLDFAIQSQLRPQPRLTEARALATSGYVNAMMDLSDGVATDIHRLCQQSQVGVIIEQELLPVDPIVTAACTWLTERGHSCDATRLALYGGEDFELMFTAPTHYEDNLRTRLAPCPITRIGTMVDSPDISIHTHNKTMPLSWGFTHF
ncbi:MAG TPA: thiamine-phosphate kinase [Armatimonadota bacterium]|nr:thiamine-phosphate kinase [Armatimonadota bacterium]